MSRDNDNDGYELQDVVTAGRGNLWDEWQTQYGNINLRNARPWRQFHPEDLRFFYEDKITLEDLKMVYNE